MLFNYEHFLEYDSQTLNWLENCYLLAPSWLQIVLFFGSGSKIRTSCCFSVGAFSLYYVFSGGITLDFWSNYSQWFKGSSLTMVGSTQIASPFLKQNDLFTCEVV